MRKNARPSPGPNVTPADPKLRNTTSFGRANWYPYYAGYSPLFVDSILATVRRKTSRPILDPWNGSGTTTTVCSIGGHPSLGYDLNPAMVIVGRARLLQDDVQASLHPILDVIRKKAEKVSVREDDPLLTFFGPESVAVVRGMQRAIYDTLVADHDSHLPAIDSVSSLAAFYLVLLFRVLRGHLGSNQSSNPTWLKASKSGRATLPATQLEGRMRTELDALVRDGLAKSNCDKAARAQISVGDSRQLPLDDGSVGGVITSPPYCTRIDYAMATRVELAVLGYGGGDAFDNFRRSLIGSPLTSALTSVVAAKTHSVTRQLEQIKAHPSKASSTYYYKTYLDYFSGLERSLGEISRVLEPGGRAAIVVQDSYYKDVYIDLPSIVADIGATAGLSQLNRWNYSSRLSMRNLNKRASKAARESSPIEAVLLLEKE